MTVAIVPYKDMPSRIKQKGTTKTLELKEVEFLAVNEVTNYSGHFT